MSTPTDHPPARDRTATAPQAPDANSQDVDSRDRESRDRESRDRESRDRESRDRESRDREGRDRQRRDAQAGIREREVGELVGTGCIGRVSAGHSAVAQLGELLEPVFTDEPPLGDAIPAIYRRVEKARRRRSRVVIASGVVVVVLTIGAGYGLTTVLLPTEPRRIAAAPADVTVAPVDPVLAVLAPVLRPSRLRIVPHEPARGRGWRQYLVLTANGRPHGLVEISAYAAPDRLCFPVPADKRACARPVRTSANVEYVRYALDRDADWQVNEVIARRLPDGRTIVVQATGERGTGAAVGGRPPLSALLAAETATDPRLAEAFEPLESCTGPEPACPVLRVPVPVAG